MIRKWYEITCDNCGCADHYGGDVDSVKKEAKQMGWVIVGRMAFCDTKCQTEYKQKHLTVKKP